MTDKMVNFKAMNRNSNPNQRVPQVQAPAVKRIAKKIKGFCRGGGNI